MALLFADSFDHYAIADILSKWTQSYTSGSGGTLSMPAAGRNSTNCHRRSITSNSNNGSIGKTLTTSGATCIVQFAFNQSTGNFSDLISSTSFGLSGGTSNVLCAIQLSGTHQVWVRVNTDGTLSVLRGSTVLGTTSAALSVGVFNYIEIKAVINGTTGSVTIKTNGTQTLNVTGANTANAGGTTWNEVVLSKPAVNTNTIAWDIDDIVIMDGSGSYNNDFLGDVRVDALRPSAAGNSNGSTPSTGADRSATVDETLANGDTDYNTFAAVNDKDTYAFTNCPNSGATVYGVQMNMWAKKADAGGATIVPVARISGTDYDGTAVNPTTGYTDLTTVWERSAVDGTTAWTTAVIDAAEFGIKKTV